MTDDDDFYILLGCDESSSIEQILAEYKILSLKYHPDKNPGDPNAVSRFQKLKKAKEILTDPENAVSAHTSVHWTCKKQKDLMLENACNVGEPSCIVQEEETNEKDFCKCKAWERDPANEVLRKFRNYEI
ncbi:dnaJ homolog subfamily C member 12 [Caerostris extrusa]|uniref:DnaJ homolog subfamily C member 12 n=1 Tax=Caerostris extrusa TaxID=172846 RepID=A0AAV4NRX7_CAEEX|nr:dnaJ homolog subfamily C member 12 [Caerostris extrusa]